MHAYANTSRHTPWGSSEAWHKLSGARALMCRARMQEHTRIRLWMSSSHKYDPEHALVSNLHTDQLSTNSTVITKLRDKICLSKTWESFCIQPQGGWSASSTPPGGACKLSCLLDAVLKGSLERLILSRISPTISADTRPASVVCSCACVLRVCTLFLVVYDVCVKFCCLFCGHAERYWHMRWHTLLRSVIKSTMPA
jgi:hypothetical protein